MKLPNGTARTQQKNEGYDIIIIIDSDIILRVNTSKLSGDFLDNYIDKK